MGNRPENLIEFRNREETRSRITALCRLYLVDPSHFSIIAFLGLGGVGKTELSRQIKKDLRKGPEFNGIRLVHVSLAIEATNTSAAPLRVIREDLPFDCLLFDYALLNYWAVTGQPVQLSHAGKLTDSPVVKAIEDGLGIAGVCLPFSISIEAFAAIRKKVLRHKRYTKEDFDEIDRLRLEPRKLLQELPKYLGNDIHRHLKQKKQHILFFYDAYERQSTTTLGNKGDWLQDFIRSVDCGIHIIASRESLRWDSCGWGREYEELIIGPLPLNDSEYLVRKMTGSQDESLIASIVETSKGIPFFLEACIDAYQSTLQKQGKVQKRDLPSTQANAVQRLFDHLGKHEADLLKLLALLRVFDSYLFSALVRDLHIPISSFAFTDFEAFFFIEQYTPDGQIFKVHDVLADFSLKSDQLVPFRLLALQGGLRSLDLRSTSGLHPQEILPFFFPLIQICEEIQDLPVDLVECLIDIGLRLYDMGAWEELSSLEISSDNGKGLAVKVAKKFLSAISRRRFSGIEQACIDLEEIYPNRKCLGRHIESVELELAYLRELRGNYALSRASFLSLWQHCKTFDPASRTHFRIWLYQADMLTMDGKLQEGADLLQEAMELMDAGRESGWVEMLRHRAHAFRYSFLLDDAERMYLIGLQVASNPSMEGKLMSNLAETRCWSDFNLASKDALRALEVNTRVNNRIEIGKNHTSLALASCGLGRIEAAKYHSRTAQAMFSRVGYASGVVFAQIAEFFTAKRCGKELDAHRLFLDIAKGLDGLQTYRHLLAPLLMAQNDEAGLKSLLSEIQWIQKQDIRKRIDLIVSSLL